ncbi:hypothetical protein GGTG_05169 [Gaeumannomyces tritici R3-111a-1]|uniref:Uncharacterized protein n=1 Tax=Gaeumannomyces tritici (strain R3-111a-1) TaxID=644352 RepID=J3NV56_GAET3|nr:hypothetical protein GGTG_05169 [Gaeumannomyces tritici R3-111a-1]EJT75232.1 hypothetical protein GGTG_05169 [Gaeumannomyces tritici R3-111a-1]
MVTAKLISPPQNEIIIKKHENPILKLLRLNSTIITRAKSNTFAFNNKNCLFPLLFFNSNCKHSNGIFKLYKRCKINIKFKKLFGNNALFLKYLRSENNTLKHIAFNVKFAVKHGIKAIKANYCLISPFFTALTNIKTITIIVKSDTLFLQPMEAAGIAKASAGEFLSINCNAGNKKSLLNFLTGKGII